MDAIRYPTRNEDIKHKLADCKLRFLSISIHSPKEIMVTTSNVDDNNRLHVHYVLPSNFSCLISFLRSPSVKLHGVKISIVLGMEGESDLKR